VSDQPEPKPEAEAAAKPEPKAKPKRRSKTERYSDETRTLAFKIWLDNDRPSTRKLEDLIFEATGQRIDNTTLGGWMHAMPAWAAEKVDANPISPEQVIAALKSAKADANQLEADHFVGIKARLVARLFESVQELPLTTVDDWDRALGCCDRIEALVHTERGRSVMEKGSNVVSSLMDRLAPNVTVAPFKKLQANGGGTNGANGGGH
jgi:hypothetical protein